jgi:Leucine-rich repeat (LRR) protein
MNKLLLLLALGLSAYSKQAEVTTPPPAVAKTGVDQPKRYTSLSEAVAHAASVYQLDLSAHHLTHLPDSLLLLYNLRELNLQFNQLTELPAAIWKLSHLQVLNVGANHLRQLPPQLGRLHQLRSLDLW